MKIKYIADDGTIFDYEENCIKYEQECRWINNNKALIMLDENLEFTHDTQASMYIKVKDVKTTQEIFRYEEVNGEGVTKNGNYFWDTLNCLWVNIEDFIRKTEKQNNELKRVINILEEKEVNK